jgi:ATP-dependent Lhr-like helicase
MIPHVLKFEVIDSISKRRIGTLDQQFVGDYGEKGNVFVLKGSQWRVLAVDEGRLVVNVEPLRGAAINIPYWVGEMIPVDYKTAEEVGAVRGQAAGDKLKLSTPTMDDTKKALKIIPEQYNRFIAVHDPVVAARLRRGIKVRRIPDNAHLKREDNPGKVRSGPERHL